jgi:hypothetical protein
MVLIVLCYLFFLLGLCRESLVTLDPSHNFLLYRFSYVK